MLILQLGLLTTIWPLTEQALQKRMPLQVLLSFIRYLGIILSQIQRRSHKLFYFLYLFIFCTLHACVYLSSCLKSIRKKSVTLQHSPSAVFHYSDTGGHSSHIHHCKVNAIFQAAKKDLLKIIQLQVRPHCVVLLK